MTVYFFAQCELDSERRVFKRLGEVTTVQPLVFDLLHFFVQNPQRVLSRSELLDAVWRSLSVSESVVARAVMKARKAIAVNADSSRTVLQNVPRVGYKLAVQVTVEHGGKDLASHSSTGTPKAYDIAILPFEFSQFVPNENWMPIGLAALLHFALSNRLGWVIAPMQDAIEVSGDENATPEDLERIRRVLGARECIRCRFEMKHGKPALRVERNGSILQSVISLTGGDCIDMTMQLAARLSAQPWTDHGQYEFQNRAWVALARALELEHHGDGAQATSVLAPHEEALPLSASLLFAKARWSLQSGNLVSTQRDLLDAMRMPDAAVGTIAIVALQAAFCRLVYDSGDHHSAIQHCDAAVANAHGLHGAKAHLADVFNTMARAHHKLRDAASSIRCSERAVAISVAIGSKALEARARLRLASILTMHEVPGRAKEVTKKALEVARQCRMRSIEAQALRLLMFSHISIRQFEETRLVALQLQAVAMRSNDAATLEDAVLYEYVAVVMSHRAEIGMGHAYSNIDAGSLTVLNRPMLLLMQAIHAWQKGDAPTATLRLLQAIALPTAHGDKHHDYNRLLLSGFLTWSGKHEAASLQLFALKELKNSDVLHGLGRANQLAAHGKHLKATNLLHQCWMKQPPASHDEMDMRLALAWLLIEDQTTEHQGDLDALAASLFDDSPDLLSSKVLFAAFMLVRSPSPEANDRWDRTISEATVLRLHLPWMADVGYRIGLSAGKPQRRLPILLPLLCL